MLYISKNPLTFQLSENITHNTYLFYYSWSITDGENVFRSITTTPGKECSASGDSRKIPSSKQESIFLILLILRGDIDVHFSFAIKWGQDDLP